MKYYIKYLTAILIAAVAASCSMEEHMQLSDGNGNIAVEFILCVENEDGPHTRAISDGKSADKLYYAIFTADGKLVQRRAAKLNATGMTSKDGMTMSLTIPIGENYKAVFWAQNSETEAYTVTDDMQVTVNYSLPCNDEKRDAFYGVSDVFSTSDPQVKVTLKRPFAQLNAGAFPLDWIHIKDFHKFEITKSCLRVRDVPHSIDLFTGELSDWGSASFKPGVLPSEKLLTDVDGNGDDEEYVYVAMAYLLADTNPSEHTAEFYFLNDEGNAVMFENESTNSVKLQRNCRTDYVGQVLTYYGDINVRKYEDNGNQENGDLYYNITEPATMENTIYNMSSHNTAIQFGSVAGETYTYNNLLFTGDIWTIELGEYRGGGYVTYNNILNNVELRNLSISSCIECHEWYFSPATIAYGKSTFNNCVMKGVTSIRKTATDKHGVIHDVIPVDIGIRNESDAWFYGGEYGVMFAWTHAVVELYDVKINTLYCGTCDSTTHSWMTVGKGTVIDKIICCEPRCPYGGKEYSTTMTIKKGAEVGSLELVSTDVEFLTIEDGASVGTITCNGIQYTYQELKDAMKS